MIYTAGYAGHTAEELKAKSEELNAVVLDIRLVPWSQSLVEWRRYALERLFGERYLVVSEWGNENYKKGGPIQIVSFEGGLDRMVRVGIQWEMRCNYILLCGCREPEGCHRSVVAELLRAEGYAVEELDW